MKKYVLSIIVGIIILFMFTGCETLSEMKDKIADTIASFLDSDNNNSNIGTKITARPSGYKIPDSYDKAYSYRTGAPDKTIQSFIKTKNVDSLRATNTDEYVRTVITKINEIAQNDFEKVKLAHDVICLLVSYDAKNFWANTIPDQSWKNVLKTKTSVCEGYANLFQKFCSELKITSQKVTGYARGVGTNIMSENPKDSNHAWNIVKIEECWYLIDCTWDSGYMKGKSSIQSYTTDWLFLIPEHFVYTHFPDDSKNQLIQPPLSAAEFSDLPDFRPMLFEVVGDNFISVKKVNQADKTYTIEYNPKKGCSLSFSVATTEGKELQNRVWTERDGGLTVTKIQFPSEGNYVITVYYWKEDAKAGQSCGQFLVQASDASDIQYPTLYQTSSKQAQLVSPIQSPLPAEKTVEFEVLCSDKPFVAVVIDRNYFQLQNDGTGVFTGEVQIPKGTKQLKIAFASSEKGRYESFAMFEVK